MISLWGRGGGVIGLSGQSSGEKYRPPPPVQNDRFLNPLHNKMLKFVSVKVSWENAIMEQKMIILGGLQTPRLLVLHNSYIFSLIPQNFRGPVRAHISRLLVIGSCKGLRCNPKYWGWNYKIREDNIMDLTMHFYVLWMFYVLLFPVLWSHCNTTFEAEKEGPQPHSQMHIAEDFLLEIRP